MRLALLSLALLLPACAHKIPTPDLGGIYSTAAMTHDDQRNPVVVVPGILGSRLEQDRTQRAVWGAFTRGYADPDTGDGARLIALPMREGSPLAELRDDVYPAGVLDKIELRFFGLPVQAEAYFHILGTLGVGGYRDETLGKAGAIDYGTDHFTCFQFAYDWRRDLAESAAELYDFLNDARQVSAQQRGLDPDDPDVRVDVVAHSMGGLVLRYMLRYGDAPLPDDGSLPPVTWKGAALVERVLIVGTPNAGAAYAVTNLVDGQTVVPVLGPTYPPAVLGTMPAVYQLLPRARHGAYQDADTGLPLEAPLDPATWARLSLGLADPDQLPVLRRLLPDAADDDERRRIALAHQAACLRRATQLHRALDAPTDDTPPPAHLSMHLFAGDATPTPAAVALSDGRVRITEHAPGDGTVTRASALLDERPANPDVIQRTLVTPIHWAGVQFFAHDHLGVTRDPGFTDNALYLLLEAPRQEVHH